MAVTTYYDNDANLGKLKDKTVAILGYGSQGHAHALNLKDSGIDVVVGLREGSSSRAEADAEGLDVLTIAEAAKKGDIIMVLIPDQYQSQVFEEQIKPNLEAGNALAFAHGFNIHYNQIKPQEEIDVFMVAPKGPGHLVRRVYTEGAGVPCLLAIYQDYTNETQDIALAYAKGIGGTNAGVIETTFQEETETDLFGEQAVLCGGTSELIKNAFETLVDAGYQPEIAYFECLHELKLIVDLLYEGGITRMYDSVSDTAEYGGMTRGPNIINESTRERMQETLEDIQDGAFAKDWILENKANRPSLDAKRRIHNELQIEHVGQELRQMFNWISDEE